MLGWTAKIRTRICFGLLGAVLSMTSAQSGQLAITFRDLPDPEAQEFDDPFRDMGFQMLGELRTFVDLEQRLESGVVPEDARPRLEERLEKARATLSLSGHDIEGLLAQRWVVAKARKRALLATNPDLHRAAVTITGFLIPAGADENGLRVGYLVPEVGMCSHTPAPPPNQLIRVTFDARSPARSLYTPVTVSGLLLPEESSRTVFVLDGEVEMASMWHLDANEVKLASLPPGVPFNNSSQTSTFSTRISVAERQPRNNE